MTRAKADTDAHMKRAAIEDSPTNAPDMDPVGWSVPLRDEHASVAPLHAAASGAGYCMRPHSRSTRTREGGTHLSARSRS
jgi:hypothetical protein